MITSTSIAAKTPKGYITATIDNDEDATSITLSLEPLQGEDGEDTIIAILEFDSDKNAFQLCTYLDPDNEEPSSVDIVKIDIPLY